MEGLELSAAFALAPNSKKYCGKPTFRKSFAAYLLEKNNKTRAALEKSLKQFTAHYAYLRLIASSNGCKTFDREVTEALWVGNSLLEKVPKEKMATLIAGEFSGPGKLPGKTARALAASLPDGFIPHHSFHVLYLHTITGVIEPSVKNADSCRVSWGTVVSSDKKNAVIRSQMLTRKNGKLLLVPCTKTAKLECAGIPLMKNLKKGDIVACHWGFAAMKLSKPQAARLEKYTRMNLKAANSMKSSGS